MAIDFRCPNCRNPMKIPERFAGKKLRCNKCSEAFVAPAIPKAPADLDPFEAADAAMVSAKPRVAAARREDSDDPPRGGRSRERSSASRHACEEPSRSSRRSRDEAPKSNWLVPTLIFGGIGVVALVVVIVCLVVMSRQADPIPAIAKGPPPRFDAPKVPQFNPPAAGGGNGGGNRINAFTTVALNATGGYRDDDVIGPAPVHFLDGGEFRGKVYQIELKANHEYRIALESNAFDSYLFVLDSNDKILRRDDDSGGNLNSLIHFRPDRTERYRIVATSLGGVSQGAFTFNVTRDGGAIVAKIPRPEKRPPVFKQPADRPQPPGVPPQAPATAPRPQQPPPPTAAYDALTVRSLAVLPPGKSFADGLAWAPDGKSCYALTRDGWLMQLNAETGAIVSQCDFGRRCNNLAVSSEGLLVSVPESNEAWLVNPAKLDDVKKKISVPAIERIGAGPKSSLAVAGCGRSEGMSLIDLKAGAVVQTYRRAEGRHLVVTADGKYAFTQGGIEQIVRYRIEPDGLFQEETGPRIASNGQRLCLSPDGSLVALPSGGGNGANHPDHPPGGSYCTYAYPTDNLKRPNFVMSSGAYPRCVAFDPISGYAFAQNHDVPLMLYDFSGFKKTERSIPGLRGGDLQEMAVHPRGFELLMRTDTRLFHAVLEK